ncbi:MAG: metallophosphoesterase family protein [Anaerovoracaceae bacterium]
MENHKLAVISDVHSNIHALEAVLRDIERKNVDQIVNLGDALIGPVDPVATAERMMKLPNLINVMGNGCVPFINNGLMGICCFSTDLPIQTMRFSWRKSRRMVWK